MEFIIDNDFFSKAISDVNRAVTSKTPFPILTGIKITADESGLTLVGSNSDIVIETIIPLMNDGVKVLEVCIPGSVVVSAKYLSEIVKKLPGKIHIKVDEKQVVTIQSDDIVTKLYGFHADDYPSLPKIDEDKYIKIPSVELLEIIKQTVFAVSKSESRPVLTGVNMLFKAQRLKCVATNSQRLALRDVEIKSNIEGSFNVPGTSLNELAKIISNEDSVIHIFISERYMTFKTNTISLFSRLIDGNYPNVDGLFPSNSNTIITLNTKQLLQGIDRACLFASEWKNNNVHLEIMNGSKIKINGQSDQNNRFIK
ncbi:DNA polymerase III subunit beta [uncultured Psychrobacillus sp.]|uniref:DNA polymerase III subunit beta n=1 Tax=uncultured Psychrobacillus sp. TaxID=1551585 RepID=UPI00261BF16B|nr:DNA polymerase III subunit beta [uncultured Psychrobacillus sp.]